MAFLVLRYITSFRGYFHVIVYREIGQRHKDYSTMTREGLGLQYGLGLWFYKRVGFGLWYKGCLGFS
jgi:hypothetical protein